jgi:hypothetical protein
VQIEAQILIFISEFTPSYTNYTIVLLLLWLYGPLLGLGLFFSVSWSCTQSVRLLGRGISPPQGCYLHRTTQTQNKRTQTSMLWVGFEPTIPAFERAKTVHALDRATTLSGSIQFRNSENLRNEHISKIKVIWNTWKHTYQLIRWSRLTLQLRTFQHQTKRSPVRQGRWFDPTGFIAEKADAHGQVGRIGEGCYVEGSSS